MVLDVAWALLSLWKEGLWVVVRDVAKAYLFYIRIGSGLWFGLDKFMKEFGYIVFPYIILPFIKLT